jgi:MFS family permease
MIALVILMLATITAGVSPVINEGGRLILLMVVFVPLGMALNMTSVLSSAAVQSSAPDEHEASVLAVYSAAITVITPVGALIVAGIADLTDVWVAVVVEGLGIGVLLVFLGTPTMRRHFDHALHNRHYVIHRHARHHAVARTLPGEMEPVRHDHTDPVASGGPPGA